MPGAEGETLGGFPVKFLVQVVRIQLKSYTPKTSLACVLMNVCLLCCDQTRLSKILMIKKEHIKHLKEMNTEAEKMVQSLSFTIDSTFSTCIKPKPRLSLCV